MTRSNRLDVVLPVKSPAPWLEETLKGILDQQTVGFYLIVVVHGEAINEVALIKKLVPNAQIVTVSSERTLVDVLNAGLAECKAEFVARIDADDIPLPNRFKMQVEYLLNHPEAALVTSPITIIDEHGDTQRSIHGPSTQSAVESGLRWKNVIAHPSVMFRRSVALSCGGYSSEAKHVEDYCLWLEMGGEFELGTLEIPFTKYRMHANQVTQTKAISRDARKRVLSARIRFAQGRGESVLMARMRHAVWSCRQVLRALGRRTH